MAPKLSLRPMGMHVWDLALMSRFYQEMLGFVVTADEIPELKKMVLTTRRNGQVMQHSVFDLVAWDLAELVSYISDICTLLPGDVIATGTPGGVGHRRDPQIFMKPGDELEIEVSGIGILRKRVVDEAAL